MSRLLLGVSGGIAAYKALEAVRLAVKSGHAVRVIQTPASERFVGRASFEAITGAPLSAAKDVAPTNLRAEGVWITRTACPASVARRTTSSAL